MRVWIAVAHEWYIRTCLEGRRGAPYLDHLPREGKRCDGSDRTLAFRRICLMDPSAFGSVVCGCENPCGHSAGRVMGIQPADDGRPFPTGECSGKELATGNGFYGRRSGCPQQRRENVREIDCLQSCIIRSHWASVRGEGTHTLRCPPVRPACCCTS